MNTRTREQWLREATGAANTSADRTSADARWGEAHFATCSLVVSTPEVLLVFARAWVNRLLSLLRRLLSLAGAAIQSLEGVHVPVPPIDTAAAWAPLAGAVSRAQTIPTPSDVQAIQTRLQRAAATLRPVVSSSGQLLPRGDSAVRAWADQCVLLRNADAEMRRHFASLPETVVPLAAYEEVQRHAGDKLRKVVGKASSPDTLYSQVYGSFAASAALASMSRLRAWAPSGECRLALEDGGRVVGVPDGSWEWAGGRLTLREAQVVVDPRTLTIQVGDVLEFGRARQALTVSAVTERYVQMSGTPGSPTGALRPAPAIGWLTLQKQLQTLRAAGIPPLPALGAPENAADAIERATALLRWSRAYGDLPTDAEESASRQGVLPPTGTPASLYATLAGWNAALPDALLRSARGLTDLYTRGGFSEALRIINQGKMRQVLSLTTEDASGVARARRAAGDAGLRAGRQRG